MNYLGITYAGNHGMEIYNADGTTFKQEMPREYYDKMHKMLNTLNTEVFMPTYRFVLVIDNFKRSTQNSIYLSPITIFFRFASMVLGLKTRQN